MITLCIIGGPQPAVLQEVNIPIWSNTDCRLKYGPAAPGGIVEHMLCAGQASRDSCSVSLRQMRAFLLIVLFEQNDQKTEKSLI